MGYMNLGLHKNKGIVFQVFPPLFTSGSSVWLNPLFHILDTSFFLCVFVRQFFCQCFLQYFSVLIFRCWLIFLFSNIIITGTFQVPSLLLYASGLCLFDYYGGTVCTLSQGQSFHLRGFHPVISTQDYCSTYSLFLLLHYYCPLY